MVGTSPGVGLPVDILEPLFCGKSRSKLGNRRGRLSCFPQVWGVGGVVHTRCWTGIIVSHPTPDKWVCFVKRQYLERAKRTLAAAQATATHDSSNQR